MRGFPISHIINCILISCCLETDILLPYQKLIISGKFHKPFRFFFTIYMSCWTPFFLRKHTESKAVHTAKITHRHVCLINLGIYYMMAASLSGRKMTKYVVCEMAPNPLEARMEVPITNEECVVWAPISVLVSLHTGSPYRGTKVVCY